MELLKHRNAETPVGEIASSVPGDKMTGAILQEFIQRVGETGGPTHLKTAGLIISGALRAMRDATDTRDVSLDVSSLKPLGEIKIMTPRDMNVEIKRGTSD